MTPPDDPRGLADDAPLLAAWLRYRDDVATGRTRPFTIPGHKQRTDLTGAVTDGDVPLFGGLDTVRLTAGSLADAEARAAAHWHADWCRFSVGGSTHGNQALALAIGQPGDRVVVTRTLHRSLLVGLALAGLEPVWVRPRIDERTGLPGAVPVEDLARAVADTDRLAGVFLTDPSYVGTCGPVDDYAAVAHGAGVPLLVDAAWGSHFGAHPDLPPFPLDAGADAVVVSAHKALPAMNQAAVVLARTSRSGGLLSEDRLRCGFEAGNTTSPSGSILASTDASRALLERDGGELCAGLIAAVSHARARLCAVPGVEVLAGDLDEGTTVDPTKLVVCLAGTGANGVEIGDDLNAQGLPVEMADLDTLVPMLTLAEPADAVDRLVRAIGVAVEQRRSSPRVPVPAAAWRVEPITVLQPREAYFAARRPTPLDDAVGLVSAELIAPYPPGVPVLAPGEEVTSEAVRSLLATVEYGGRIAYAADPSLSTIQTVLPAAATAGRATTRVSRSCDDVTSIV